MRAALLFAGWLVLCIASYDVHAKPRRVQDPNALSSGVAYVIDQDTNEVLYERSAGETGSIASITKLMTAVIVADAQLPMDEVLTITNEDIDTYKGTGSRLPIGTTLTRGELLALALMASENRAANALGRHFPGGLDAFVSAMNAKAAALGMAETNYVEPTGLSYKNKSSARDLATLVKHAYDYPLIRTLSTTKHMVVRVGTRDMHFGTTNKLVKRDDWDIGLQKTGFIKEAGLCLVMQASVAGRKLIMVLLHSRKPGGRMADAEKLRKLVVAKAQ